MQYLDAISTMTKWSPCFQGKSFNITVIQVYALTSNAEETEVEQFYEDLQDLLVLTPKKDVLLITGGWNAKVGCKETPGVTCKLGLGVQNEAGQRLTALPREHTGHSKHPLPTTQETLYTWTSPDGRHQNQIYYVLCSQRWRSSIESAKTRPGADCGSDHEFLIAKFRLKLKKVEKTTRPFMYDLNQIPYDYIVEVRNRFKGLYLIYRVPDKLENSAVATGLERSFSFQSQRKAVSKNVQLPHRCTHITYYQSNFSKQVFNST